MKEKVAKVCIRGEQERGEDKCYVHVCVSWESSFKFSNKLEKETYHGCRMRAWFVLRAGFKV